MTLMYRFVIVLLLFAAGCSAPGGSVKKHSGPWFESAKDQSLRKQVESDNFPSAKQAGL